MNVSILFATYKRNDLLELMLESFTKLNTQGVTYEIVAVDNCPDQTAKRLVTAFVDRLPITYYTESQSGKNAALTTGLRHVKGDLIVFTDDDIEADPDWLQVFVDATVRYPQYSVFAGMVMPKYPPNYQLLGKDIDLSNAFVKTSYGEAGWTQPEGPVIAERIWGANMAVHRRVFDSGLSFNVHIGPQGANYAMGSETEFLMRAYAKGFDGIYLPSALVHHHVRPEQFTMEWICGRAYRMGRGRVQMDPKFNHALWLGVPRYLYKNYFLKKIQIWLGFIYGRKQHFCHILELHRMRGQFAQYRMLARQQSKNPIDS